MTATLVDARPGRAAVGRFMTPLLLGASLNPINSSIIATALVAIGRDFGVGPAVTASLVAALYLASAIGQPALGTLADRLKFAALATRCATLPAARLLDAPETTTQEMLRNAGLSHRIIEEALRPFFSGVFSDRSLVPGRNPRRLTGSRRVVNSKTT